LEKRRFDLLKNDKKIRYTLVLSESKHKKISEIAKESGKTLKGVFEDFIKIGIFINETQKKGEKIILEEKNGKEKRIIFF
jgi:hypothetical protein